MSKSLKEIVTFFKIVCDSLNNLSEEQLENLLSNSGRLVYKDIKRDSNNFNEQSSELKEIADRLIKINSRNEAFDYINSLSLAKPQLTELANLFEVYIVKKDKKEKIIEKIIESVVGAKLRVDAIRITELKRTPNREK